MNAAQVDLFVASFLALFMEVMFIRWIPSYERVLAYFTNFVLIGTFLGLGLGAMMARSRRTLLSYQSLLLTLLVTAALWFYAFAKTRPAHHDVIYSEFYRHAVVTVPLVVCLVFFFSLIAVVFIPIGQTIGQNLRAVTPVLRGYILNIAGSLLGVIAFAVVSFWEIEPVWWFGGAFCLLLWLLRKHRFAWWAGLCASVVTVFAVALAGHGFIWSPYHKLTVSNLAVFAPTQELLPVDEVPDPQLSTILPLTVGFDVAVDDDFLQMALDLSDASLAARPYLKDFRKQYDWAYSIPHVHYDDVLIVGAGTGNDTAAALRHGAKHIDAVEIDPAIVRLGTEWHPNRPYKDPRVTVYVDDARSFFHTAPREYDLVVFGLLDSHRLFSSMSSVRLDSFVFTVESFREVRRLLKKDGMVVVEHGLGAPFMGARMFEMLNTAFGAQPYATQIAGIPGATYAAGPGRMKLLPAQHTLVTMPVEKATDDWPFFYLEGRFLPTEYVLALLTMFAVTLLAMLICSRGQMRRVDAHFFLLGSAFLLIETLSVTRFALLFGSTWMVNSIVFSAILVVVLLACFWMNRASSLSVHLLYVLLAAAVVVNFAFPIHVLLGTGLAERLVVSMILMASPIFFASLIFARSFKQTPNPELAFASNLLGAVLGGLLEYSSLVIGFRKLLLIALVLYGLSYVALFLQPRKAAPA
ncbi:MAG TPA: hypothetical protein VL171_08325 [Verrucomicrobiae bacterium]|nr:hypothetical protein [Verrucomicrobiae bacterium]